MASYGHVWTGSLTGVRTHTQKVKSLYKRALRTLESWCHRREVYRYQAVQLRKRFDDYKCITDEKVLQELLCNGESELFQCLHYCPKQFPLSPGGCAYARVVSPPDWVIDYWHPLEKAQYPEYFSRREERKKQYVKYWQTMFGKSAHGDSISE